MSVVIILLIIFGSGGFGGKSLDLSDPAALAEFRRNVGTIVEDPARAANVSNAIYQLNILSHETTSSEGSIEKEISEFRQTIGNYNAKQAEVYTALRELEISLTNVNRNTIQGRDVIRRNTTKKEWKKLLKELSKK